MQPKTTTADNNGNNKKEEAIDILKNCKSTRKRDCLPSLDKVMEHTSRRAQRVDSPWPIREVLENNM